MQPPARAIEDVLADKAPAAQFTDGLVEVFSDLADLFGNPRSVGAIYGVLFSSVETLSMDDIATRLDVSKGSVSQGLRTLEEFGAIERHVKDRERTARYSAKHQLKPLIAGFVRQRLIPRLEASSVRLEILETVLDTMPATQAKEAAWRLERVTQWHNKARTFLPLARKILGGG
jgi:DNA-binding transcriptional regulator GbsR (MarR family)